MYCSEAKWEPFMEEVAVARFSAIIGQTLGPWKYLFVVKELFYAQLVILVVIVKIIQPIYI
tara:strand:- start:918 stop:1100 length:183 start_codon:yes stop_codon:yes gene_type:complete